MYGLAKLSGRGLARLWQVLGFAALLAWWCCLAAAMLYRSAGLVTTGLLYAPLVWYADSQARRAEGGGFDMADGNE